VFLRRVLGLLQQHYLERSKVIIVANAPGWFSFLWTIIKPLLHPVSRHRDLVPGSDRDHGDMMVIIIIFIGIISIATTSIVPFCYEEPGGSPSSGPSSSRSSTRSVDRLG
jgi:hypothetical protein